MPRPMSAAPTKALLDASSAAGTILLQYVNFTVLHYLVMAAVLVHLGVASILVVEQVVEFAT